MVMVGCKWAVGEEVGVRFWVVVGANTIPQVTDRLTYLTHNLLEYLVCTPTDTRNN